MLWLDFARAIIRGAMLRATAAKAPTITTTTNNSTKVNPWFCNFEDDFMPGYVNRMKARPSKEFHPNVTRDK